MPFAWRWTTALHYAHFLDSPRVRALLRGGAVIAGAQMPGTSPLMIAATLRALLAERTPEGSLLVLRAAEPWSPESHSLFPPKARARAMELVRLGASLARQFKEGTCEGELNEVWRSSVLPLAIRRHPSVSL
jgi:CO/xanthine dehydrogenase Mo-binding subunit